MIPQTLSWQQVAKICSPDRPIKRATVCSWVRRGCKVNGQVVCLECWRGPSNAYVFTADQVCRFLAALQSAHRGLSVAPEAVAKAMTAGVAKAATGTDGTGAGGAEAKPAGVLGPGGKMYPPLTRKGQRAPAAVLAGLRGGKRGTVGKAARYGTR